MPKSLKDESIVQYLPKAQDLDVGHGARREAVRYALSADVRARCGRRQARGFALNISKGGLRVGLDRPFEVGDELDLTLRLSGRGTYQERMTVVWMRRFPDGCVAGLSFPS